MIAFLKRLSAPMRSRKAQLALAVRVTVAAFGALARLSVRRLAV